MYTNDVRNIYVVHFPQLQAQKIKCSYKKSTKIKLFKTLYFDVEAAGLDINTNEILNDNHSYRDVLK